jgi:hypothetical protein
MTNEEIEKAVSAICKKAGILVGQLAEPASFQHLAYEAARFHLSHLVGKEALHGNGQWHSPHCYEKALNMLDAEIKKALEEVTRRA